VGYKDVLCVRELSRVVVKQLHNMSVKPCSSFWQTICHTLTPIDVMM